MVISALVSLASFRGETSGGVAKRQLFSQVIQSRKSLGFCAQKIVRPGSDAVLFMCRTLLNNFDFGATPARHLIQTAHRVSRVS